jgi:hypothetical protein
VIKKGKEVFASDPPPRTVPPLHWLDFAPPRRAMLAGNCSGLDTAPWNPPGRTCVGRRCVWTAAWRPGLGQMERLPWFRAAATALWRAGQRRWSTRLQTALGRRAAAGAGAGGRFWSTAIAPPHTVSNNYSYIWRRGTGIISLRQI